MHGRFVLVLFKNKQKKKIIKSYQTLKKATKKFKELTDVGDVIFPVSYENAEPVVYEVGLLSSELKNQTNLFTTDNLGRNTSVFIEGDSPYVFVNIKQYNKEERIYDWQTKDRIFVIDLIKKYCKGKEMKNIFTLNNKLLIQIDEEYNLFSLKNSDESHRLLSTIEDYFRKNKRTDAIFVKDVSTVHRKWIYNILTEKGFDKNQLYRQSTTFSKRK
jgi:hypothetical protein